MSSARPASSLREADNQYLIAKYLNHHCVATYEPDSESLSLASSTTRGKPLVLRWQPVRSESEGSFTFEYTAPTSSPSRTTYTLSDLLIGDHITHQITKIESANGKDTFRLTLNPRNAEDAKIIQRAYSTEVLTLSEKAEHKTLNKKPYVSTNLLKPLGSLALGSGLGFFAGKAILGSAACVAGVSSSLFLAACTASGAGLVLLLAWAVNRCVNGPRSGFFAPDAPRPDSRVVDDAHSHSPRFGARA